MMTLNPNSKLYRIGTIYQAFKSLYKLSPKQVDAFIHAYEIYDCDWVQGQAVKDAKPLDYQQVKSNIISWYSVLNHLCAIGEVEKMYIPPTLDPAESVINNQILFERRFCKLLGMKPKDKVFELGCGKGRVAAHMASLSDAHITAINIDQGQLNNAKAFAKKNGLDKQCKFVNADFNDLPLPYADNSFDSIYEIQALSLSRDLTKLFAELHRILKPGGKISLLEWVRLNNYDPQNSHHVELMQKVKPLIGAIGTPSPDEYEHYLQQAGFKVVVSEDPSVNKSQIPLIDKAGGHFDKLALIIKFLVKIKVFPQHFSILFERLGRDTDALCEADRKGLVTMCYHMVAQKE